jgi:hypothetical protein
MLIAKDINQYNCNNIYFCDSIKNNIMVDGQFIRIIYSTENFILNGISILLDFKDINISKYYNKFRVSFCPTINNFLIDKIIVIEHAILQKFNIKSKQPSFKLTEQINNNNIKLFIDNEDDMDTNKMLFILKISGIWETDTHYGITYKFIKTNHLS